MPKTSCFKPVLIAAIASLVSLGSPREGHATDLVRADGELLARQWAEYEADRPKSILEIQPFRRAAAVTAADGTEIKLTSLNPGFNTWFLLDIATGTGYGQSRTYHLELTDPAETTLSLRAGDVPALIFERDGVTERCTPWAGRTSELAQARESRLPFAPVCNKQAFVRNEVRGSRTSREAVAEFLRDNVVFGESIVGLIKGSFYEDAYMSSGEVIAGGNAGDVADALGKAKLSQHPVFRAYFGFDLEGAEGGTQAGSWYAVKDAPGIYASAMQPGMIHPDVLDGPGRTHRLDTVERRADVYLVAFDLSRFELGYVPGTDHPRLNWSSRPSGAGRNPRLPGPDGFNTSDPVVRTGMLSPALTDQVAATFAGGFKRDHGAWRAGEKAFTNYGHHYGFLANGVLFSKLHPGLSTIFVLDDGSIHMRKWQKEDQELLPRVKFARQNGVPLIENGVPGAQVTSWLGGNWSGSAKAELRTLRAGACMKTVNGRKFLIYAYFSTVTPSGMARTFQAYGCEHAMLLDMNSQEHTYMALYQKQDGRLAPQHLVRGMSAIDSRARDGSPIPRFVGFADNRDFIYLLRK
ncbi:hypothetical protein [Roseovarius salis]|uniref:hypothetical protein n=1 Tax=Roseovarius salis TaxID=3376063 RepID=UPI0037C78564